MKMMPKGEKRIHLLLILGLCVSPLYYCYGGSFYDNVCRRARDIKIDLAADLEQALDAIEGDFQPITVWDKVFAEATKDPAKTEVVSVDFETGETGDYHFEIKVPKLEFLQNPAQIDIVAEYVMTKIFNRLGTIGVTKVTIDTQYQELSDLVESKLEYKDQDGRSFGVQWDYLDLVYGSRGISADEGAMHLVGNPRKGEVIGVDLGATDIKVVVLKDGELVWYEEHPWQPQDIKAEGDLNAAQRRVQVLVDLIKRAVTEGGITDLKTIGISWPAAVVGNRVVGTTGKIDGGLSAQEFREYFTTLAATISSSFNDTPVFILNDGKAAAKWASLDMGLSNVLALSLGSGLASGYSDSNGNVVLTLNEMGNVIIDMNRSSASHTFTRVPGVLQQYLSQDAVIRLAQQTLPQDYTKVLDSIQKEDGKPDKGKQLKFIQALLEPSRVTEDAENYGEVAGYLEQAPSTANIRREVKGIYETIGRYLAVAVTEVKDYFAQYNSNQGIKNIVLFGRVTSGRGGEIIADFAQKSLDAGLGIQIVLPSISPEVVSKYYQLLGEVAAPVVLRRIGQAIGIAYYAAQMVPDSAP